MEKLFTINADGEKVLFYNYNEDDKTLRYLAVKNGQTVSVEVPLAEMHVGIQHGNIKVGEELILNTLPGDHPLMAKGVELTNMRGSCQGCCDGCEGFCYAINGCRQHHNSVMPSVMKNLILYREDRERFLVEVRAILTEEVRKAKKTNKDLIFRWHSSGEIESPQYLEDMMDIAEEYPTIHFYSYTKRFSWIADYLDKHGDFPTNFCWNLSVWKDNLEKSGFPSKYLPFVQRFAWDDMDDDSLINELHCPTVVWDGKSKKGHLNHEPFANGKPRTCANCGICWRGKMKGKLVAVYNH